MIFGSPIPCKRSRLFAIVKKAKRPGALSFRIQASDALLTCNFSVLKAGETLDDARKDTLKPQSAFRGNQADSVSTRCGDRSTRAVHFAAIPLLHHVQE
jgi:hypothetical protein